jgi:hypothetical protein
MVCRARRIRPRHSRGGATTLPPTNRTTITNAGTRISCRISAALKLIQRCGIPHTAAQVWIVASRTIALTAGRCSRRWCRGSWRRGLFPSSPELVLPPPARGLTHLSTSECTFGGIVRHYANGRTVYSGTDIAAAFNRPDPATRCESCPHERSDHRREIINPGIFDGVEAHHECEAFDGRTRTGNCKCEQFTEPPLDQACGSARP